MKATISRRSFFAAGATLMTVGPALAKTPAVLSGLVPPANGLASDEKFWAEVRQLYDVTDKITNLENGYWGTMAEPVRRRFAELTQQINHDGSYYARRHFGRDCQVSYDAIATELGVGADEIVLTRGASEALQNLISGYNLLKPGDAVLYADLDYDAMIYAMRHLERQRGVEVIGIDLPEPATPEAVLQLYRDTFDAHPNLRLMLLTHLSHRTGLVLPVAAIAAEAKARGIDVILDAAHSWGQMDFRPADFPGVDFIGFNLHKWIGNPQGAGLIYIRKDRIEAIDPYLGDMDWPADSIRARAHTGTPNMAAWVAIPDALALHRQITARAKQARMTYLRDMWVDAVADLPNVQVLTPNDPTAHAGITSLRLNGKTSKEDNVALSTRLAEEFGVFTTRRGGVAAGDCVRVTPFIYSTEADVMKLAAALRSIARG